MDANQQSVHSEAQERKSLIMPSGVSIGDILDDRYKLIELVGRGGCGLVMRAEDLNLQRDIAIKVLSAEGNMQDEMFQRFEQESLILRKLHAPNTVSFFDTGKTPSGIPYIAMEFVVGTQLTDILAKQGKLPPRRTMAILTQVLASISEAHSYGFIHRDLKPSNIMLCKRMGFPDDFVKVLDFGIARVITDNDVTDSASEDMAGTPKYMAPELFKSEKASSQTDLYAIGCIAYEMLSGTAPFDGDSIHVSIAKQLFMDPPPLAAYLNAYPNLLASIFKLLSKDPANRFASAQETIDIFEHWEEPELIPELMGTPFPYGDPNTSESINPFDEAIDSAKTMALPQGSFASFGMGPVQSASALQPISAAESEPAPQKLNEKLGHLIPIAAVGLGILVFASAVLFLFSLSSDESQDETSAQKMEDMAHDRNNSASQEDDENRAENALFNDTDNRADNGDSFLAEDASAKALNDDERDGGFIFDDDSEEGDREETDENLNNAQAKTEHRKKVKEASNTASPKRISYNVIYDPSSASVSFLNATGKCSKGQCRLSPANPKEDVSVLIKAKGYSIKSIKLNQQTPVYYVDLIHNISSHQIYTVKYTPTDAEVKFINGRGSCIKGQCKIVSTNAEHEIQGIVVKDGYASKRFSLTSKTPDISISLTRGNVSPDAVYTVTYMPKNATVRYSNGTGSCANGVCRLTPINPNEDVAVLVTENGYRFKSIRLNAQTPNYAAMLVPENSN